MQLLLQYQIKKDIQRLDQTSKSFVEVNEKKLHTEQQNL